MKGVGYVRTITPSQDNGLFCNCRVKWPLGIWPEGLDVMCWWLVLERQCTLCLPVTHLSLWSVR